MEFLILNESKESVEPRNEFEEKREVLILY